LSGSVTAFEMIGSSQRGFESWRDPQANPWSARGLPVATLTQT
jgi:hypothetical protein